MEIGSSVSADSQISNLDIFIENKEIPLRLTNHKLIWLKPPFPNLTFPAWILIKDKPMWCKMSKWPLLWEPSYFCVCNSSQLLDHLKEMTQATVTDRWVRLHNRSAASPSRQLAAWLWFYSQIVTSLDHIPSEWSGTPVFGNTSAWKTVLSYMVSLLKNLLDS